MASMAKQKLRYAGFCLLGLALFILSYSSAASFRSEDPTGGDDHQVVLAQAFPVYSGILNPKFEVLNNTEYVYQIPARPKAVLFLAHGCSCKATFFWDKHPQCEKCSGVPEERTLVIKALQSSYAVIAVSSSGVCWSQNADSKNTEHVLHNWIDQHSLVDLPILGLGASSGGYFLSRFARSFKFDAIVLMIAEGRFHSKLNSSYPPVLFVHMPKDEIRAEKIWHIMLVLRRAGIRVDEIQCMELSITDNFFAARIPYIDLVTSLEIRKVLVKNGCLDRKGYMKLDGRQADFESALKNQEKFSVLSRVGDNWEHHIREELNLAYAYHEFTSIYSGKILTWLDSRIDVPMSST